MNEHGNITVMLALFLPVIMALFMLVADGGSAYLRKAELTSLASSGGEYLLSRVSDELTSLAEIHCAPQCPLPPVSYLTEEEFRTVLEDPFAAYIINQTKEFIGMEQATIEYPFEWNDGDTEIKTRILISDQQKSIFGMLFGEDEQTVSEISLTKLSLI